MMGFTIDQLQQYVTGKADPALAEKIKSAAENDLQLAEQIAFMRETTLAYETNQLSETLTEISKQPNEDKAKPTGKLFSLKWILRIAAILAVPIALWFFFNSDKPTQPMAFDDLKTPPLGLPTPMGKTDDYIFMDAMVDYKAGNYAQAIAKWEFMSKEEVNDTVNFYLASAFFAQDELEASSDFYQRVLRERNSIYTQQTYWYLAVIAVEQKKYVAAKAFLDLTDHPSKSFLLKQIP